MKIKSLYLTQSAVINLCDMPFYMEESSLRNAFIPIFTSKNCFADMGEAIYDSMRVHGNSSLKNFNTIHETLKPEDLKPIPVTNAPFICKMGQICFNTRSMYFLPKAEEKAMFASQLGKRIAYWKDSVPYREELKFYELKDKNLFGYDHDIKDQRQNFLYFELRNPFKLHAQCEGKTVASGKVFLHLYPSGHIVIHFAVYMRVTKGQKIDSETKLFRLIEETRPWLPGRWKWQSKFGCHSLQDTFQEIVHQISMSIFEGEKTLDKKLRWHPSVMIATDTDSKELKQYIRSKDFCKNPHTVLEVPSGNLFVAKKNINYYFASQDRNRRSILHSFWKLNHIYEFILYKKRIAHAYIERMEQDMAELRKLQLNKEYKVSPANIFGKDFYCETIYEHRDALSQYTYSLQPVHRKFYWELSDFLGLTEEWNKLWQTIQDWESNIKEWKSKPKLASTVWNLLKK